MKKVLLIALTALALGLASIGVGAPAIAAGNAGAGGGDIHAAVGADAIAGSDSIRIGAEPNELPTSCPPNSAAHSM